MKTNGHSVVYACLLLGLTTACLKRTGELSLYATADQKFEGVATHFDSLGIPYGGCGVPENILDSTNYVALNVQDTPNDYTTFLSRPISDASKVGAWDNGRNCGRWVKVTMGDFCKDGVNGGQKGSGLCQGGSWVQDEFNGAELAMVVVDSCQDDNVWCRDSRGHLDLSTSSLEKFKPGLSGKWGNRKISWQYIDAPGYQGDITIGFRKDAKPEWPAFIVNHLQRGLHGIEQQVNGSWQKLKIDGDMGQSYILQTTPDNRYKIRLTDASDQPVGGGRAYDFAYPASCGSNCPDAFTKVDYTTSDGSGGSTQTSQQTPGTQTPGTQTPGTQTPGTQTPGTQTPGTQTSGTQTPSQPSGADGAGSVSTGNITAEIRIKSEWQDGYCADLVIHNTGSQKINSWGVVLRANGTKLTQQWNLKSSDTSEGTRLEPAASWNSAIDGGAEMSNEGFCVDKNGSSQKVSVATVSSS